MRLAELLTDMDRKGVSLVQLQSYMPGGKKSYSATVGWFRSGIAGPWSSSCASAPTQEDALEAAMRSTGLFPSLGKPRRASADLLA